MSDAISLLLSPATWFLIAATILYLLYKNATSTFNYFSDRGIPGPKPVPFFGNIWGLWKDNMIKYDIALMKKYGKIVGFFEGTTPFLWTTDPELIRSIFIKDFDHFVNRRHFDFSTIKVVRKMITLVRGQEWKDIRSSITPAYTTGKIKRMSTKIQECSDRLAAKFETIAKSQGKMDAKNEFGAFTMDVIARCAFGMEIENLGSKDDPFIKNAQAVFSPPVNKTPVILLPFLFPKLMSLLGERIFLSKSFLFFTNVLENLIQERHQSKEKYNDFIEAATEAILDFKKDVGNGKTESTWNREEVDEIVIAQSTLFLVAGFDTTATTLTGTIFNLAKNPEIQERLYNEIQEKLEHHGQVNHDMILDFPYLDNIINESLRMYPPVPRIERQCNKEVVYKGITIKEGMVVTVPTNALHYDPEHYPEPEKYNPDRWSSENKGNISPYVWMPFGMGPRNCVGMRFAMEEMKIALCTVVNKFRFFPVPETNDKMEFEDGFLSVSQPIHAIVGVEIRG